MKKFLSLFLLLITISTLAVAQKFDSTKIKRDLPKPLPGKLTRVVSDIKIFDQPNYKGNSGYFTIVDGKLKAPFPVNNVSFNVPSGKIVYLKKCDTEFPYEEAYTTSQGKADLTKVCGIRTDDLSGFTVQFNGVSAIIHNNDCKRVFGDIKIKVFEHAPGDGAQSFMTCGAGTYFRGASALREGRVSIMVTSNLGSAHKTCDLCDDFTSNCRMSAPVTEAVPLNKPYTGGRIVDAGHNRVVLGPYHAHGSRDGSAITASAGTDKDFRVHLTITGL
jgi:hypothetical protein